MGPRYPAGPRPGVRMPQMGNDFNGVCIIILLIDQTIKSTSKTLINIMIDVFFQPPGQPMMPNSMDPTRQGKGSIIC